MRIIYRNWEFPNLELPNPSISNMPLTTLTLTGDASIRALTALAFRLEAAQEACDTDWMSRHLMELINDPYDAVRYDWGEIVGIDTRVFSDRVRSPSERFRAETNAEPIDRGLQTVAADRQREDRSEVRRDRRFHRGFGIPCGNFETTPLFFSMNNLVKIACIPHPP